MSLPPLTRHSHRQTARPALTLAGELSFALSRVHEIAGPARRSLALIIAGALQGPVVWIAPTWQGETLCAAAMQRFCDPGRITFFTPSRGADLLWTMEEVLRTGAVPLVVTELADPPGLTPVRRLHLAAETGAGAGVTRPLGCLLTPGEGGAQGIETRWHLAPDHALEGEGWRLARLRARAQPPKTWRLCLGDDGARLSETGERPLRASSPLRGVRDVPSRTLPDICDTQEERVS